MPAGFPLRPGAAALAITLAITLGAGLSACAGDDGGGWAKPGVTPAQRAADNRACRAKADDYALRQTQQPDRLDLGGRDINRSNPLAQVDRAQARDAHRRFYAECMRAKGYTTAGRR